MGTAGTWKPGRENVARAGNDLQCEALPEVPCDGSWESRRTSQGTRQSGAHWCPCPEQVCWSLQDKYLIGTSLRKIREEKWQCVCRNFLEGFHSKVQHITKGRDHVTKSERGVEKKSMQQGR